MASCGSRPEYLAGWIDIEMRGLVPKVERKPLGRCDQARRQPLRWAAIEHRLPAEHAMTGTDRQRPQPDRQRYRAIACCDGRRQRERHMPGVEPLPACCGSHDAFGGDAIAALRRRIVGLRENGMLVHETAERDHYGECQLSGMIFEN
jgi:hypothetical protein